jgi:1-deoxy-D-xylulose-5-phosphate reductoisomerase
LVSVGDARSVDELRRRVPEYDGEILAEAEGIDAVATHPAADLVVAGLVGAIGLMPTLRALSAGKDVALANKEALVVAGELMTRQARKSGVRLFPIDSEHNAIFQALRGHEPDDVRRIILTASGGPFLRRPAADFARVSRAEALKHPTWKMGDKITIDSATLMNKGLEVIEAHWLFGLPADQIDVVIHPQSIVHSMVEYIDGSVIAQLGIADMTIPISYILAYPRRLPLQHLPSLDLSTEADLEFHRPDTGKFRCLALAYEALRAAGTAPAVLNAANEVAVAAFLAEQLGFAQIPDLLERAVGAHTSSPADDIETLLEADRWGREFARRYVDTASSRLTATA